MSLLVGITVLYFVPAGIAISNKKSNAGAIVALNILAGWLFIPWVIALCWAMCKDKEYSNKTDEEVFLAFADKERNKERSKVNDAGQGTYNAR